MNTIPTIKVKIDGVDAVINACDFDPKIHKRPGDPKPAKPEARKPRARKAEG